MKKQILLPFSVGMLVLFVSLLLYFVPSSVHSYTPAPYESSDVEDTLFADDVLGSQTKGSVKVPVLMYHNIAPVPRKGSSTYKGLFVSPSMFQTQMKYLKDNGYKTLTPDEFYKILKGGVTPKQKSVLITFDDGSRGQYTSAYPILKKYNMTATFYIIADKTLIKPNELKAMAANGMIIDSHTSTHRDLKKLTGDKNLKYELESSKTKLESITGKTIQSIAYPGCVADNRSFKIVNNAGYKLGFSCGRSIYHRYENRYYLSRVHVFNDMSRFKSMLQKGL